MDNEELDGVKFSEFPSQTPVNADEVVGLHSGDNARFSIANIVAAVRNGLASIFVPLTRTVNSKALTTDISLDSSDIDYDNTQSGLTATDVQEAIDELAQGGGGGPSPYTSNPAMDGTASPGSSNDYARGDHVHPTDSTKAAKADLTNIQATGTTNTTGAAIPAGIYFYLNGVLVRAKADIATNASYTSGTNYETVTAGGLNAVETFKPGDSESVAGLWVGIAGNNGQIDACVPMTKRIPTGANISLSGLTVAWVRSSSGTVSATYLGTSILGNNVMVQFTVSGFTAYRPYFIYITAGTVTFS